MVAGIVSRMTAAVGAAARAASRAGRSLNGIWGNSSSAPWDRNDSAASRSPAARANPVCPWYAPATETTRRRPVARRADLIARSIASPPPLAKTA